MKKRIIIPTLLSAALFTACVKDTESDSVKNYRDAQTEKVKAESATEKAKADLAKAEVAVKEQDAALQKQLAELKRLEAEAQANTNAEAKAKFELELEKAKLEAQKEKLRLEREIAEEKAKIDTSDVSEKEALLEKYTTALNSLNTLKGNLATLNYQMIGAKNRLDLAKIASEVIAVEENKIKVLQAEKEALKSAITNVQDKKIEKAKKEAEQKEKNIAYQVAIDNYNKEASKYDHQKFNEEFRAIEGADLNLGTYFVTQGTFVHIANFIDGHLSYYNIFNQMNILVYPTFSYIEKVTQKKEQDGLIYFYDVYSLLKAENLVKLEDEIVYLKDRNKAYKTQLDAKTTALTTAKKATADARKAWQDATGADKDVKFSDYQIKLSNEEVAQQEYNTANANYENGLKNVEHLEKALALLNNLEPFNKVIDKYNKHRAGLSTLYFTLKKAEKAYEDVDSEIQAIESTIAALETGKVADRILQIDQQVQELRNSINTLKGDVTAKEALITQLERHITALEEKIKATEKLVEALKAKL